MVDQARLYISAAADLRFERDLLGRAIAEIPTTLGWRILQSPIQGEPFDPGEIRNAQLHILIMGEDIRAPIGAEWAIARQMGLASILFLKQGMIRTQAGDAFVRHVERYTTWRSFQDPADLRYQTWKALAEQILSEASFYALKPKEIEQLREWLDELEKNRPAPIEEARSGASQGGVILSPERYIPSEGVLIQPKTNKDNQN
jgi:hypothetical protein